MLCTSLTVRPREDDRARTEVSLAAIRHIRIAELKRRAIGFALTDVYLAEDGTATILDEDLGAQFQPRCWRRSSGRRC